MIPFPTYVIHMPESPDVLAKCLAHLKAYAVLPRIIEQHDTIIPP